MLRKYPGLALVLIMAIAISTLLFTAEFILQRMGVEAGVYRPNQHFQDVDELIVQEDHCADEAGIMRFCPELHQKFKEDLRICLVDTSYCQEDHPAMQKHTWEYQILLREKVREMLQQKANGLPGDSMDLNQLDSRTAAIHAFKENPINSEGFKSIPFDSGIGDAGKRILLVGDSYTYGWSAKPFSNCFADLLLQQGYTIYNTGMSNTDPYQYLSVIQKWVPALKPDLVVINFYWGNDITLWERPVIPNRRYFYTTNANWMLADYVGVHIPDPYHAHDFMRYQVHIPPTTFFNRSCAASRLGTRLWAMLYEHRLIDLNLPDSLSYLEDQMDQQSPNYELTNQILKNIQAELAQSNTPFLLVLIPDQALRSPIYQNLDESEIFDGIPYHRPTVDDSWYNMDPADGHFNNLGHQLYSEYLDSLIQIEQIPAASVNSEANH